MTKHNLFTISNQVAVVTGAGANGGIGHAIAQGFAQAGANLAICDIDEQGLAQTTQELKDQSVDIISHLCDISNEDQVNQFFTKIDKHFGRVDILVNVPFYFPTRVKPHNLEKKVLDRMLEVNITGYFLCIKEAIKIMLHTKNGGSIINIGSNAGITALGRGAFPYSCTKGAINQMTKELAVEYAGSGIRTNAILPAQTITPGLKQHLNDPGFQKNVLPKIKNGLPMGDLLKPEDFVGPAIFLASQASSAVNGVLLPVDQGNTALNAGGSHNWEQPISEG
jgi:NAD(P)-dependent dehydrogenase (short-subunit alcohol dehydrogenase family)